MQNNVVFNNTSYKFYKVEAISEYLGAHYALVFWNCLQPGQVKMLLAMPETSNLSR